MHKLGPKEPTIQELKNSLPLRKVILDYRETNDSIRNKVTREICHIGEDWTIKAIFGELVDRALIEQVPGPIAAQRPLSVVPSFRRGIRRVATCDLLSVTMKTSPVSLIRRVVVPGSALPNDKTG